MNFVKQFINSKKCIMYIFNNFISLRLTFKMKWYKLYAILYSFNLNLKID